MHTDKNLLNVVLHGLFVLHVRKDHIELLTPSLHDHVYYAGARVDTLADLKDRPLLREGQAYSLVGVNQFMTCPPVTHHFNTVISASQHGCEVQSSHSHVVIRLPFPYDISPIRSKAVHPVYAGKSANAIFTDGVSLCQVLVYPLATFQNTRLWGTNWIPKVEAPGSYESQNLHIWAEPARDMNSSHARHAYPELMKLIPPVDLDLITDVVPKIPDPTGMEGIAKEDLYGLAELPPFLGTAATAKEKANLVEIFGETMANKITGDWAHSLAISASGGPHGSKVTNCQAIIVTS
jgi:hypothetical protein